MKVCVYGCGAIGGLIAARLARSGAAVSVVARGQNLVALQTRGLTLIDKAGEFTVPVAASSTPAGFGPQDVVILAMKSHNLPAVAPKISLLLAPSTMVVTAANGIPWWFFHGLKTNVPPGELKRVDPGRQLWHTIGADRAVGCVVYPAAELIEPGVVRHTFGDQFAIGEPDGSAPRRIAALAGLLNVAGFDAPVKADIRSEIWTKLVANASLNPMSVLTGQTLGDMIADDNQRQRLDALMTEVTAVAEAYGGSLAMTPQQLLEASAQLADHKTSMLCDYEAGRELELDPIVGAVIELGGLAGVPTVELQAVYDEVSAKAGGRAN